MNPRSTTPRTHPRRAATLVLFAVALLAAMAMLAFAIDLGHVMLVRTQLQVAADAAAMAGAAKLGHSEKDVYELARDLAAYHVAGKDINADYIREMYDGEYYPKYRVNFDGPRSAKNEWQEGSIIIFAFDPATRDMVWRSSATAEVTDEAPLDRRVDRLNQAIKMMFSSLPGK